MSSKCAKCNRRLNITAIVCRCGDKFCAKHRLAELHDCSYDYKKEGREHLSKSVVGCNAIKVDKI